MGLSETNGLTSGKERGGTKRCQELGLASASKEERRDSRKRRSSRNLSASGRTERRTRGGRTVDQE